MNDPAPADEMGDRYADRSVVLCRTCMRPLTWETRTEPGYLPRTGWYDDARSDPLVCFKAADYQHVPLTAREWAYYKAGAKTERERIAQAIEDVRPPAAFKCCDGLDIAAAIARTEPDQ
jgi:hypothetical protein